MDRRRFLVLGAAAGVAGCLGGDGGGDGPGGGRDGTTMDGSSTTGTADGGDGSAATLDTHPAARDLAAQPRQGPDPADATGVIVAFEDPSCPSCRTFERETVPQIRSELVEPGDATLVFRGYPVIYEWGQPAVRALEATFDVDPAAHWTLAAHYFDRQSAFRSAGPDAVYDRTETFLAENTDLDATAVVDGARNGEFDAAVRTDLDAGMDAGAGRRTPHVFFFRDGVYQTKVSGVVSYPIVTRILQL